MITKQDFIRKWIENLRSGQFTQGQGALHVKGENGEPDKFCCLGIACQIAVKEGILPEPKLRQHAINTDLNGQDEAIHIEAYAYHTITPTTQTFGVLPLTLATFLNVSNDPNVNLKYVEHFKNRKHFKDHATLSELNDEGLTFEQLATIIENNF